MTTMLHRKHGSVVVPAASVGGGGSYLNFDKMPKRQFFFDSLIGAHDSRFEQKMIYSFYDQKKIPVPNFKKQMDRDPFVKDCKILMVKT